MAATAPRGEGGVLEEPLRLVRHLSAPADAPWSGRLCVIGDGGTRMVIDSEAVGDDWAGWDATDVHVLSPEDVLRTASGHDIVLPVLTDRLDALVQRRGAAGTALDAGETVTVIVSVLRGWCDVALRADHTAGQWWLTDDARPVLAAGVGQQDARQATCEVLQLVGEQVPEAQGMVARAISVAECEAARMARELEALEGELFAWAPAQPIATTFFASRRSVAVAARAGAAPTTSTSDREPRAGLLAALTPHVDADLADMFSRATTAVWRVLRRRDNAAPAEANHGRGENARPSRRARSRRGPVLVGATAFAAVLGVALLFPTGASDSGPVESVAGGLAAPAEPDAAGEELAEGAGELYPEAASLEQVAAYLIAQRQECVGDPACLTHVVEDPATALPGGAIDQAPVDHTLTLLDEMGAVAVLRLDSETAPAQLLVLVHRDEKWLLRDVHDVAEQP